VIDNKIEPHHNKFVELSTPLLDYFKELYKNGGLECDVDWIFEKFYDEEEEDVLNELYTYDDPKLYEERKRKDELRQQIRDYLSENNFQEIKKLLEKVEP
jgi:hypothetical protein